MLSFVQLFSSDPAAWIRTGLRVLHFCGLVFGVGAATLLDLVIARFVLMRGISFEHIHIVDFSSKVVTVGLALLWISGIGFLIHYGIFDPAKLENPKIWAKIAIVAVLSVNGFLVHYFVLPRIRAQVGKRLLDGLSPFDCSLVLLAGTVSAISWYVPLILGAVPQLNYVVPAGVILASYALLLIAVNTVIQVAIAFFLSGYSFPVISDRGKMNILRGSFALALVLICGSVFMTKATDYGEAFVNSATRPPAREPKVALAPKEAALDLASSRSDKEASGSGFELEQSHTGALRDFAVTAVWQKEGRMIERTVLVSSNNAADQELLNATGSAESFASLPKAPRGTSSAQLNSGFVGLWAADARACQLLPGTGSDLLTVIGERGARAGAHNCEFKEKKQVGNTEWEMKAACADGSARWDSTVRLSVSRNKLKWSGQRGSQTYVRCGAGTAPAQVKAL